MQMTRGFRGCRFVAAVMLAMTMAGSPGFAAGGGGHGGMGGAGGGGRGLHGDVFHVRGGARPERAGLGEPADHAAPAGDAGVARGTAPGRGSRAIASGRNLRFGRAAVRRGARIGLRRIAARERRLRTRRCSPSLAERYGLLRRCDGAGPYARHRR